MHVPYRVRRTELNRDTSRGTCGDLLAVSNKNFDEDFDKAARLFHQRHRMRTLIRGYFV